MIALNPLRERGLGVAPAAQAPSLGGSA